MAAGTSVVLLGPAIAKAFPTSKAVNEALASLLLLTEKQHDNPTLNQDKQEGAAHRLAVH